jgi:hypothetical protein
MADCSDDPDCRLGAELHLFLVSCHEVECACSAEAAGPSLAGAEAAAS